MTTKPREAMQLVDDLESVTLALLYWPELDADFDRAVGAVTARMEAIEHLLDDDLAAELHTAIDRLVEAARERLLRERAS